MWASLVPMLEGMEGKDCYAGLDLSTTTDVSALALVFHEEEGGFAVSR